jgi:hypothetical protein
VAQTTFDEDQQTLVLTKAFFRGQGGEVLNEFWYELAESVANGNSFSSGTRISIVGVVAVILPISSSSLLDLRPWICCV